MYGLTLLVAILACIWLTGRRWVALGGDWDLVTRVAVWGVAFGVIGARLYHDLTSWSEVPSPKWQGIFEVWKGGLGVWGGIGARRRSRCDRRRRAGRERRALHGRGRAGPAARPGHRPHRQLVEPGALRQADRPAVGAEDRPAAPACRSTSTAATYHPTFLYELIWDFVGVVRPALRRPALPDPAAGLFALYVAWYTFGRFFEELLRIDPSHHIAGLRLNAWVSIIVFVASAAYFVWCQF